MKMANNTGLFLMVVLVAGCSTKGTFKVPEGCSLYIYERPEPVEIGTNGLVQTRPYFWTATGIPPHSGIPYRLEKDGKVLKSGRLRTKFRVVSIFWPPFAVIYWPMGMNPDITYDLINDTQE